MQPNHHLTVDSTRPIEKSASPAYPNVRSTSERCGRCIICPLSGPLRDSAHGRFHPLRLLCISSIVSLQIHRPGTLIFTLICERRGQSCLRGHPPRCAAHRGLVPSFFLALRCSDFSVVPTRCLSNTSTGHYRKTRRLFHSFGFHINISPPFLSLRHISVARHQPSPHRIL